MPTTLYDQDLLYDSVESYDAVLNPRFVRRDLFAVRDSDLMYNFQAVEGGGEPIDVQEYNLTAVIQEYECGTTFYPAIIEKIYPEDGIYQLKIDHTTKLTRQRYIYSIIAQNESGQMKLNYGHILVEQ